MKKHYGLSLHLLNDVEHKVIKLSDPAALQ